MNPAKVQGRRVAPLLALGLLFVCAGCGGSHAEPPASPAPAPETDTAPPGPKVDTAASAEPPAPDATNATTPGPSAPPAPGPAASADPPAEHDPCSDAAIPYEEKVRPLFNACYQEGKKKNPDLTGTIKITINVNTVGKVSSVSPAPSELGDSVVHCMVKAVKANPFSGSKCEGKSVSVGKTFGKP